MPDEITYRLHNWTSERRKVLPLQPHLGRRAAVVSDRDGVTRDRHYQNAIYKGHEFTVVDTGGFLPDDSIDVLADSVRAQIFNAVNEADLVLFMVDIRVGITKLDQQFARLTARKATNF